MAEDLGHRRRVVARRGAGAGGWRGRGDAGTEGAARLVPRQGRLALLLDLAQRQAA